MRHPSRPDLALFAGGDLGFLRRWSVSRHLEGCAACRHDAESLRSASEVLRGEASELPDGLNWDRLAREMTANIHLGLEAGECVGPARVKPAASMFLGWRAAAVMAVMSMVLLAAWVLNPPRQPGMTASRARKAEIRTTSTGLELNANGAALVLLHGRGERAQKPIIVSAPGALRARYVDEETDQITINHVYAE
jgi:hypothetical protein